MTAQHEPMRVALITGSRDLRDTGAVALVVQAVDVVIVGCAKGADRQALFAAIDAGVFFIAYSAEWGVHDNAGPLRNARMVNRARRMRIERHTVTCHAFPMPRSRGTWDCVTCARKAGFVTWVHGPRGAKR